MAPVTQHLGHRLQCFPQNNSFSYPLRDKRNHESYQSTIDDKALYNILRDLALEIKRLEHKFPHCCEKIYGQHNEKAVNSKLQWSKSWSVKLTTINEESEVVIMGRRGENIRKRTDGRWEARVVQGRPIAGQTNYKYLYGRSYQEVRRKKKEFLLACQSQALPVNAASPLLQFQAVQVSPRDDGQAESLFCNAVEEWLHAKRPIVKESTLACYTVLIKEHILPRLGDMPMNKIDSDTLGNFLVETKAHGRIRGEGALSDKTVSDIKAILMQILTFAKTRGMLAAVPECPAVSSRRPDVSVLTDLEQKRVEKEALEEDTPFSLGVLVSLYGGVRIGEVCGLQWKDFDCKNGTITISKTVSRITVTDNRATAKTKVVIGTPKTDCSARTIPLPATVFQYLMQHRRSGDCYLVTGTEKYMEPRVCLNRYKRFLHRAGVSDHTFHTLRHTFATRCVENGVDVKSLSEIMGHADVKITMQRYVHPSMDSKKAQVNKLPCFQISGQNRGQAHPASA